MMQWPPDFHAENIRRYHILRKAVGRPDLQSLALAYYRDNPIEWMKDFCVTFDPRNQKPVPRLMPFIPFPRQIDNIHWLLQCIRTNTNGLEEKTRDVGATWDCVYVAEHQWLFEDGFAAGFGSLKEDAVDKRGDPKSIFSKLRMNIDYLPDWMLPDGFDRRIHDTHMKLINPANNSSIIGECGDNIGRGGRTTVYFKDESAHYEHPESIEASLGDNTNVQIDISSVNGSGNIFYRRRMAGEVWYPDQEMPKGKTSVFIFDWRDHPAKTQEWYDMRRNRAVAEGLAHIFAQEVDRDYAGALEGIIIKSDWVNACVDAHIKLGFGEEGMGFAGQDIADGGGDRNALACRRGVILRFIDHWGGEAGEAARISVPECITQKMNFLNYDGIGVGSGFKTEINRMQKEDGWPQRLRVIPWMAGEGPLDPDDPVIPGDMQSPTNDQVYKNLKAQAWFRMGQRCYKTYRAVTFGDTYDPAELCSFDSTMPLLQELKMELSQAVKKTAVNGKTIVDKKPQGTLSPNLADACVMAYNPVIELSVLDVL